MSRQDLLKIVGVIPARSGSKGVPGKNTKLLAGKPLIAYTIQAALESRLLNRVVVSTDGEEVARIARKFGAEVPFLRPAELARDETPRLPVIRHAVGHLRDSEAYTPDIVVTLQPTSPLRRPEHIDAAVKSLINTRADRVVSVCEVEHSPYWMQIIGPDGRLRPFLPDGDRYLRRQDLPVVYRLNGAIYAETYGYLCTDPSPLDPDTRAFMMDRVDSVDIDTELDFRIAELRLLTLMGAAAG